MHSRSPGFVLAAAIAASSSAAGQASPPVAAPASAIAAPAAPQVSRLAPGTVVSVELAELVSTRKQKIGDHFAVRLALPIIVDGKVVMPAGAAGFGEVIDVASGGIGGRPAKLVVAVRSVEFDGLTVRLHALRIGGGGQDNSHIATLATSVPYVGILAYAFPGGDLAYPPGTRADAKVAQEVNFPATWTPPAQISAPNSPQSATGTAR
jgi:hypothetical protein